MNYHNVHYPGRYYATDVKPTPANKAIRGAKLFEMMKIVHLTIQQRAECEIQQVLVEDLQTGLFKMDFQMRSRLKNHVLTPADVENDISWVLDAIVLVLVLF